MGRGRYDSDDAHAKAWHDEEAAREAARLARAERERTRRERVPDHYWRAEDAIARLQRERAGLA